MRYRIIHMHNVIHRGGSKQLLLIRTRMLLFPDRIHLLELQDRIMIVPSGVLESAYGQNDLVGAGGESGVDNC